MCLLIIMFDLVIICDLIIFDLGNIAGVPVEVRMYDTCACCRGLNADFACQYLIKKQKGLV